jgi:predicted lysophospholipase L1 biosynthesis ABC-type transport system permease subunit
VAGAEQRAGGQVVGVVGDVRQGGPGRSGRPTLYLPHAQWPTTFVSVVTASDGDPARLIAPSRAALAGLDRDLPMFRVRTMEQLAGDAVARPALYMRLLAAFGLAALVLAALGLYGVLAHAVSLRTRELAVRLALGASRAVVVGQVVRQGLVLAGTGIAGGVAVALLATRALDSLLFGVARTDAATYLAVVGALLAVAVAATWIPAWRAARVDPIRALRGD